MVIAVDSSSLVINSFSLLLVGEYSACDEIKTLIPEKSDRGIVS
ncbi:hypothetical protein [Calothrix sp. UHCC 0171]|nr:hypothetical protein [Calothrix sp. UHCC 0171]MEA5573469.1 hypothetical protein [Calothrix sp. UHCC 0171]